MELYANASVMKKANIYFDGKVTSRTVLLGEGSKITLGVVLPGEYSFSTSQNEIMEVIAGKFTISIKGADSTNTYGPGQSFEVPAGSEFTMTTDEISEYACAYSD